MRLYRMSSPEPFQNGEGLSQNIALKSPLFPLPCYFIFPLKWICAQSGSNTTLKTSCYSTATTRSPRPFPPPTPSLYGPPPWEDALLCRQWRSLLSCPYKADRLLSFNLGEEIAVTFVFKQGGQVFGRHARLKIHWKWKLFHQIYRTANTGLIRFYCLHVFLEFKNVWADLIFWLFHIIRRRIIKCMNYIKISSFQNVQIPLISLKEAWAQHDSVTLV